MVVVPWRSRQAHHTCRIELAQTGKVATSDGSTERIVVEFLLPEFMLLVEIGAAAEYRKRMSHKFHAVPANLRCLTHFLDSVKVFQSVTMTQLLRESPNVIFDRRVSLSPSRPARKPYQAGAENKCRCAIR